MRNTSSLVKSILITVFCLLCTQWVIFSLVLVVFSLNVFSQWAFYITALLFHLLILAVLYVMKPNFIVLPSREKLDKINVTNKITLFRISSLPTICYLLILSENYPMVPILLVFTALVFMTDLFDGLLARRTGQVTQIGKYMDSASDYSLLLVISIAFLVYDIIPPWFFLLIIFRLVFQMIGTTIVVINTGTLRPETSFFGKATIFSTMVLYCFEIFRILDIPWAGNNIIVNILEYITGAIIVISIFDKFFLFKKIFNETENETPLEKENQ
jgi:cardiolipin synthase (CMP-forming)